MNKTLNLIIAETQSALMKRAPKVNSREDYAAYVDFEQNVAQTICELDAILTSAINDGADKNTLKRIVINYIS